MRDTEAKLGWTPYSNINTGVTGVVLKSGPGQVGPYYLSNLDTATVYVKLYDKATAPTNTDTPVWTFALGTNVSANLPPTEAGLDFLQGVGLRASGGLAASDNTAVTANTCVCNFGYR